MSAVDGYSERVRIGELVKVPGHDGRTYLVLQIDPTYHVSVRVFDPDQDAWVWHERSDTETLEQVCYRLRHGAEQPTLF